MASANAYLARAHSVLLGSRKKLNSQITTFLTQQSFLIKSGWGEGEDKKVGLSKEQAKFEKEDVEEVEDGR